MKKLIEIPIGSQDVENYVWRAFKPMKKKKKKKKKTNQKTIYRAESVFTTTLLSLNNCRVHAKMKTQGIPVLSNPSVFHPVPILF